MTTLKDLVSFVTRRGITEDDIFNKEVSNQRILFQLIFSGSVETDKDAMMRVFGNSTPKSSVHYRKTKSRLMERLYASVLSIKIAKDVYSASYSSEIECVKDLAIAEILLLGGATLSAREKYRTLLTKAEYYSFTQKALTACEMLLYDYSQGKNSTEMLFFEQKYKLLSDCLAAEKESDAIAVTVNSILTQFASPTNEHLQTIKNSSERVNSLSMNFPESFKLRTRAARFAIFSAMLSKSYLEAIDIGNKYLLFLRENAHLINRNNVSVFNSLIVQCATLSRDVVSGKEALKNIRDVEVAGTANWRVSIFVEIHFLLSTENFLDASESLKRLQPYVDLLKSHQQEKFRIYQGYLIILSKMSIYSSTAFNSFSYSVRDVFLNWEIVNHDKHGLNIHTIIHYFLLSLIDKNINAISARTDTTRAYRLNHLGSHPRTAALFFRFERLAELDFDYEKIEHYAKRRGFVLSDTNSLEDNELVPFDKVWLYCKELISVIRMTIIRTPARKK